MSKYTAVYTGNVVGIYKDGEQMTIEQIVSDLNTKAVEPVQRCNCCGYLVTDSEHKGCLRAAKQEPAQVVPVAWKHDCAALLTNNVELWIDACPHCGKPRSAPPAIDDETKRMVLELCDADN